MKKFLYILLFTLLSSLSTVYAQVTVEAKIDSLAMLIGEQTNVTLTVNAPSDKVVQWPQFKAGQILTPGVEIVDILKNDTTEVDDNTRSIARRYVITSFDENAYKIPSFKVKVEGKEYTTNPLALKVLTVDVDTTNLNQFFGPKDVQDNPFQWNEWSPLFWMSFILLLLLVIAVYLYICLKNNRPIIIRTLIVRHIPAHKKALNAIDRIKSEKLQSSEDQKTYYTELTDTIRQYIVERFGFNAKEMTSSEIIEHLSQSGDSKMIEELRELFRTADLVKFAKHETLMNENDLNLVNAINFIDVTKTQEQETDVKIVPKLSKEDRRVQESRKTIKVLLWIIGVFAVLIIGFVIYNVIQLI